MDLERYIARQALHGGKFFSPDVDGRCDKTTSNNNNNNHPECILPKAYCGYSCHVYRRQLLSCTVTDADPYAVVSLSLLNWQLPALKLYASKIPLMCINVNRLEYTVNAFKYGGYKAAALAASSGGDAVTLALNFLIETDIEYISSLSLKRNDIAEKEEGDDQDEANAKFSKLLHILRSNGYEYYIFALGRYLDLDVDLTYCQKKNTNHSVVFRYKRDPSAYKAHKSPLSVLVPLPAVTRTGESNEYWPKNGVLTAVHHYEAQWFVRVTQKYIIQTVD
nr:GrBNV_gp84-like protein [Apis mellifera nudivirus]